MWQEFDSAPKTAANFVPLSPISFLKRAALVYQKRPAVSYGEHRLNWGEFAQSCRQIAAGLRKRGIGKGDTVSVLLPNIPELFELHFAVAMAGGVLNTINTRLEADTIAYILEHSDCKTLIFDSAYSDIVSKALSINGKSPDLVEVCDGQAGFDAPQVGADFQSLKTQGMVDWELPADEWDAIALNYTSGTSGRPKGVIYHHRGAYLMALGTVAGWSMPQAPTYLSVVPMFHCNGWNHPWAMAILGGHMVFTRDPIPAKLFAAIRDFGVTHMGAAPIVLQMLCESADAPAEKITPAINVLTAGAPPPPAVLERATTLGLNVMQVYGLTETYGHISQCLWQEEWSELPPQEQAAMQAMQGVAFPMVEDFRVMDRETGSDVLSDGETQGEIVIRGNTVMKGYYKNPQASEEAFDQGWFWSGDAAVIHPDGYVQIKDRLKDVIISGGENISSVEIEAVLHRHPAVQVAAVVARPHARWGESPCAFIELREGQSATEDDIISFCREHLAGFKAPKSVVFDALPKTATGKIQKFILRDAAKALGTQEG